VIYFAITLWWCCLHPIEHDVFVFLLESGAVVLGYIPVADFDLLWALTDPDDNTLRKFLFLNCYSMHLGTRIIDEEEVDVWEFGFAFWSSMFAFSFTEPYICEELCPVVKFHKMGM
jgi:hypothetical protein